MADPYLIPGTCILRNKLGLTDPDELAEAEYEFAEANAALLFEEHRKGKELKVSMQAWKKVHRMLFQDVFDWAGQYRTIFISKENHLGTSRFCDPERIEIEGARAMKGLAATLRHAGRAPVLNIQNGLAHAYVTLNKVHPFREGNGRSQKLLFTLLTRRHGLQIDWTAIPADEHGKAAVEGAKGHMELMQAHFQAMCQSVPPSSVQLLFPSRRPDGVS